MKLSFEEVHKNTICELGGLQTIGEILAVDFMANAECNDHYVIALRKYAGGCEEILLSWKFMGLLLKVMNDVIEG